MPRYRPVVLAAACALALAAPASAAYAASAHHAAKPVLTVSKKGGPAVGKRAALKASLAKGKDAMFALKTTSFGTFSATCSRSTLRATVAANPSQRGKATLSLTGETVSHCKLSGVPAGLSISLTSIKALNLPYGATVSSAKGFPITIAGSSATKPLTFQATIDVSSTPLTCAYTAKKATAHASNTGNKVSLVKQKLTLAASSPYECAVAPSVTFSATYGPLRDTSVKHSPKVFFN